MLLRSACARAPSVCTLSQCAVPSTRKCQGGDGASFTGHPVRSVVSNGQLWEWASQAARLLQALYVHGDVKESNFCQDEHGNLSLIDLEFSVPIGATPGGYTSKYRAPDEIYTAKGDSYSLGVALARLVRTLPAHQ